jgi:hypothetical protein
MLRVLGMADKPVSVSYRLCSVMHPVEQSSCLTLIRQVAQDNIFFSSD